MTSNRSQAGNRRQVFRLPVLALSLISAGLMSSPLLAAPDSGVVRAGQASIQVAGSLTRIVQSSDRAVIDWRGFGTAAGEAVRFEQPSSSSATLNRVTGSQMSVLAGRLDANGQVFLVNPHGILFGKGAQVNVGGLIASTANIDNQDFMAGRLVFSQPGQPGASVVNAGTITAAESGLVALVAPQVRNDGIITARLGKVTLAAGDTFTLDLYGDQLISLAMRDAHVGQLADASGQPVTPHVSHAGTIDAAGGKVVLVTAATGKSVLDEVINLSGVIRADAVGQQGGEIRLLGYGGTVNISGNLSADGRLAGQRGGKIEVLGDHVNLAAPARLDASGQAGGGTVHVGGAFQGQGDTYRAQDTTVAAGAQLNADALVQGNGGEVVVWADGHTDYAGNISARGGQSGGDGGRVEVSGKQTLAFNGYVDAGAPNGQGGSLLLDPTYLNIGAAEASLINMVLRTGTSTSVQAGVDINLNAMIDGRGRTAGGGFTMTAGNNINLNNAIVTNDGTVRLNAGNFINIAPGVGVFTGYGALYVTSGNTLNNLGIVGGGLFHLTVTAGDVNLDRLGIYTNDGNVEIDAPNGDININQPVILTKGSFTARARDNVNVNAQIDGSGGDPRLSVTLAATTGNINLNNFIVTNNGTVSLDAGNTINLNNFIVTNNGTVILSAGNTINVASGYGVFTGYGALYATGGNTITNAGLVSAGLLHLTSRAGNVNIDQVGFDEGIGNVVLDAAQDVNIDQPVINLRNGSSFTVHAGNNITVNAQIDGRGGVTGGTPTLTAGNNILLNESILTNNAPITLNATAGTVTAAANKGLFSGDDLISVTTGGNYSTGIYATTGALALRSSGGKLTVATTIDETVGNVSLRGQTGVDVNQGIANIRNGSDLTIFADTGNINVNARIDAQNNGTITPVAGGAVTLTASNNVNINETIVTNNGAVNVTATNGTVTFFDSVGNGSGNKKIITGNGPITVTTGGNFSTGTAPPDTLTLTDYGDGSRYLWTAVTHEDGITSEEINQAIADQIKPWVTLSTTGKLTLTSTGGTVSIDAPIPYTTGEVEINGNGVVVNEHLVNAVNQPITINAGSGGIVVNEAKSSNYSITTHFTTDGTNHLTRSDSASGTTIDAKNANLTLHSIGDIDVNGYLIASAQTLTLDTRGTILSDGGIDASRYNSAFPQVVNLIADQGIGGASTFQTNGSRNVTAVSSLGNIYLGVYYPDSLSITTGVGDIKTNGPLGSSVGLNAGRDIDVTNSSTAGVLTMQAGRDVRVQLMDATSINITHAGNDVIFDASYSSSPGLLPGNASIWLNGLGGLSVNAVGNIQFLNDTGVSIKNDDPTVGPQPAMTLTSTAGSVEFRRLQTYGAVSISAGSNITLYNDIGPTITAPIFFTANKGVASLTLTTPTTAGHTITMQGARAVGNVNVTTNTLTAAKSLTQTSGAVSITAPTQNITAGAIGTMAEMTRPPIVTPVASPGPAVNAPTPPLAINALPAGAPGLASALGLSTPSLTGDVPGLSAPSLTGDVLSEVFVPEPAIQVAALIESEPTGSGASTDGADSAGSGNTIAPSINPLSFDTATGAFLVFAGGRGGALEEERRR